MRYQLVRWLHELEDEPVALYSEIDEAGREVRKVEEYKDGRLDLADAVTKTGSTVLSETRMPDLDDINAQPEFSGHPISRETFEEVWSRAWRWFDDDSA